MRTKTSFKIAPAAKKVPVHGIHCYEGFFRYLSEEGWFGRAKYSYYSSYLLHSAVAPTLKKYSILHTKIHMEKV